MTGERQFKPADPEFAVLSVAQDYFQRPFENSPEGLHAAVAACLRQHERIMPPSSQVVSPAIVRITAQMAEAAMDTDDYEVALSAANYLYAYAEAEMRDSTLGEKFQRALDVHRMMAYKIRDRFSTQDPYLKVACDQVFVDAARAGRNGYSYVELNILRRVTHKVACNGTLGQHARGKFDPLAIVVIGKRLDGVIDGI